ncbi:hypothetical protein F4680DRAFT_176002 [Xylaria scruposa]|nr:hypothetical protein F4680DRAFT_176002 [Xylaria scruposa]
MLAIDTAVMLQVSMGQAATQVNVLKLYMPCGAELAADITERCTSYQRLIINSLHLLVSITNNGRLRLITLLECATGELQRGRRSTRFWLQIRLQIIYVCPRRVPIQVLHTSPVSAVCSVHYCMPYDSVHARTKRHRGNDRGIRDYGLEHLHDRAGTLTHDGRGYAYLAPNQSCFLPHAPGCPWFCRIEGIIPDWPALLYLDCFQRMVL